MEIESWWLLAVALFFGLGWFAARADHRSAARHQRDLPQAWFRGLDCLLNEQPDKAIDAFLDVVRLDPETIELHFALGNLFRRRGETDRAIRIHLNLVDRRDLPDRQREQALLELGQDYLKAGLLDRAEDAFMRLEGSRHAVEALTLRADIAQRVRDWPQAISLVERLAQIGGAPRDREIAHFHCELAAAALAGTEPDRLARARAAIASAQRADPAHPRPWLLAGECALAEQDPHGAIAAWSHLRESSPAYLALVARGWLTAHQAIGQGRAGIAALQAIHRQQASIDTLTAIVDAVASEQGHAAALAWAQAELHRQPSLLGLEVLLALREQDVADADRDELALTRRLIQPQTRRLARFVCGRCGFRARQFYWQCPGCSRWDSYAPKRTEEIERG